MLKTGRCPAPSLSRLPRQPSMIVREHAHPAAKTVGVGERRPGDGPPAGAPQKRHDTSNTRCGRARRKKGRATVTT